MSVSIAPKGITLTRVAAALMISKNVHGAATYAATRWGIGNAADVVLRGAISAGSVTGIGPGTAWGQELAQYQVASAEILDAIYGATCFMRLPGLRSVPYSAPIVQFVQNTRAQWVGEGLPKAGTAAQFASVPKIEPGKKVAAIIVESLELLRALSPQAEKVFLTDLTAACGKAVDASAFADVAATVSHPAGLPHGAPTIAVAAGDLLAAIANAFAVFKGDPSRAVFVANATTAIAIGTLRASAGGALLFPGAALRGGQLLGVQLFISAGVAAGQLLLIDPGSILVATDPISFDVSGQTSLQLDDTPDSPATAATVVLPLWQTNRSAVRVELAIDWLAPVAGAVVVITTGLPAATEKVATK